jgi:hypothetical protein
VETSVPVCAELEWLKNKGGSYLFSHAEALERPEQGIYIPIKGRTPRKVGQTPGFAGFSQRLKAYPSDWNFYLAIIKTGNCGISGITHVPSAVEYAIARLLYRVRKTLPEHDKPKRRAEVMGDVNIKNILPPSLERLLTSAYGATGLRTGGIVSPFPVSGSSRDLVLQPVSGRKLWWELS